VAGFFMMIVHLPLRFSLHEYLAKRKSPLHSLAPHQAKCFATCFLFPKLKIAFSGISHDSCNALNRSIITILGVYSPQETDCRMKVTTVLRN